MTLRCCAWIKGATKNLSIYSRSPSVGRFDEAGLRCQRAIDICRKTRSEDHLDYTVLLENHAVVLRKLGRKREAKKADAEGKQIERAVDRDNGVGLTIGVTALRSDSAVR